LCVRERERERERACARAIVLTCVRLAAHSWEARVSPVRGYGASGAGGGGRGTDGRVSRALVAAGLSCLALMVLAMVASAGSANAKNAATVGLQMRAQQLRMSMLQQDVDASLPVPAAEQAAPADGSEAAPAAAQADGSDAPSSAAGTLAEQSSTIQTAVAPDGKQTKVGHGGGGVLLCLSCAGAVLVLCLMCDHALRAFAGWRAAAEVRRLKRRRCASSWSRARTTFRSRTTPCPRRRRARRWCT